MYGLSLVGITATGIVSKVEQELCFELTHYNKGIAIVAKIPRNKQELYQIIEKIKQEYLNNEN